MRCPELIPMLVNELQRQRGRSSSSSRAIAAAAATGGLRAMIEQWRGGCHADRLQSGCPCRRLAAAGTALHRRNVTADQVRAAARRPGRAPPGPRTRGPRRGPSEAGPPRPTPTARRGSKRVTCRRLAEFDALIGSHRSRVRWKEPRKTRQLERKISSTPQMPAHAVTDTLPRPTAPDSGRVEAVTRGVRSPPAPLDPTEKREGLDRRRF